MFCIAPPQFESLLLFLVFNLHLLWPPPTCMELHGHGAQEAQLCIKSDKNVLKKWSTGMKTRRGEHERPIAIRTRVQLLKF